MRLLVNMWPCDKLEAEFSDWGRIERQSGCWQGVSIWPNAAPSLEQQANKQQKAALWNICSDDEVLAEILSLRSNLHWNVKSEDESLLV